ncbi:MAG: hypothetical protein RL214_1172, partial [Pseudomonadota bacterium]
MDIEDNKALNRTLLLICSQASNKLTDNKLTELFAFFEEKKTQFDAVNLSTLLHNLSKLIPEKMTHPQVKYFIAKIVCFILSPHLQFGAQSIANILRALSIGGILAQEAPYQAAI